MVIGHFFCSAGYESEGVIFLWNKMINEHIATIEKSIKQIVALEKESGPEHDNQLVRWVMNKEKHADELQHIVSRYFMTQRIKFDAPQYEKKLELLHQMLVFAMKCKQTADLQNVGKLRNAVAEFEKLYFIK